MFKNVASQKCIVFAFDATTNLPKTGDAANITAYVSKDYGAVTVLGDTSATEMDSTNAKGYYLFDLTQGETNADTLLFSAKSSTANIVVVGAPSTVFTNPPNFTAASIDSNGRVDVIKIAGTTQTARDIGASVLLSAGSGTGQLDFTSGVVKANVTQNAGSNITSASGIQEVKVASIAANAINNAAFDTTAGPLHKLGILDQGTAQSVTGTTIVLRAAAAYADDELIGATVYIVSATTGAGQSRLITDYVGATDTATVDTWTTTPTGTIVYEIFATAPSSGGGSAPSAATIAAAVWQDTTAGDFTVANSIGKSVMNGVSLGTGLTIAAVSGAVGSVTGAVGSVTGAVGSVTGAVGSVTGNVGGNVTGSIGSLAAQAKADVNAEVDSALDTAIPGTPTAGSINDVIKDLDARLPGSGTLSILSAAAVNAEVVDALAVDTYAEPAQGAPPATTTIAVKLSYLYKGWRNKITETSTTFSLYADDATTVDHKATVSDDGTTFTRGEIAAGP